jgi:hypothetical protein
LVSGEAPASFQCSTSMRERQLTLPSRGTTSIVFGENQLSPSLIGLSPLPTAHPKLFQQLRVRTSTRHYPSFILAMGRSLRFRVYPRRLNALFRLAFATAPLQRSLTLPARSNSPDHNAKGTQSGAYELITHTSLLPLVGTRFQDLFHSPPGVLFTFPSRYSSLSVTDEYVALEGGPPSFPRGFSCPVVLRVRSHAPEITFRLRDSHPLQWGVPTHFGYVPWSRGTSPASALQPRGTCPPVWAPPVSLAATSGISFDFFSRS